MNIRCSFCQTPYTIGRIEKLDALQHMETDKLNHYDAHCPRCRRATAVPRQKLELTMPNWREALKELEVEMKAHPQQEAPLSKPEAAPAPAAESKPVLAQPQAEVKSKSADKKPAAKSSAPKAKARPAAKPKTPAKKKK